VIPRYSKFFYPRTAFPPPLSYKITPWSPFFSALRPRISSRSEASSSKVPRFFFPLPFLFFPFPSSLCKEQPCLSPVFFFQFFGFYWERASSTCPWQCNFFLLWRLPLLFVNGATRSFFSLNILSSSTSGNFPFSWFPCSPD